MNTKLKIGYSDYHGWYVQRIGGGVLANGFASKEAAEKRKLSIKITNQYIEKFKKGEVLNAAPNH